MERKLIYTRGNLFTGSPWAVEAVRPFDSVEVHGPFSSENEANTYAHRLVEDRNAVPTEGPYTSVTVVQIETPQRGQRIVRNDGGYEYAV